MITTDHLMIDRRILQEALSLRQAGYDVEIMAGFECPKEEEYSWNGIRISRYVYDWDDARAQRLLRKFTYRSGRVWYYTWNITKRLISAATRVTSFEHFVLRKVLARDFDILHVHDFPLLSVGIEIKRRTGCLLVYDAHELYHAQSQLPQKVQAAYKRKEGRLIHRVDAAITVNDFIARIMAGDYGCAPPSVILNAAPELDETLAGRDIRAVPGLPPETKVVLYQGWLSPERGIDVLVRAARHLPRGISLVLVGYGDHEADLRKISAEQGTDDGRVIFYGRVEPDELASLTMSADLGIIPYWAIDLNNQYCSPNKLFEFAVAALPFVSNDLPFLRKMIDTYHFGAVANLRNPEEAAAGLLRILNDPETMRRLQTSARAASTKLVWAAEAEKLLSIYAGLEHRAASGRRGIASRTAAPEHPS